MLEKILTGSVASSSLLNNNFNYLDERITDTVSKLYTNNSSFDSKLATVTSNLTAQVDKVRPIGQPIIRLDDTIFDDEVRLEGEVVSRVTYASLFSIYGITYGSGDGATTFKLPDYRNRAVWGSGDGTFGYLEPALPNITGRFNSGRMNEISVVNGAFYVSAQRTGFTDGGGAYGYYCSMDASRCSSIYKNDCKTVQPPAIKHRVVTRYK